MSRPAAIALASALLTSSCAGPLMKLPKGPGVPVSDTSSALDQALARCRGVTTMSAEVALTGTVGGHRTRARLVVGVAAPDSTYIEAPALFGAPIFLFSARGEDATLLLPRDRRALEHGRAAEVLEAIAGVPLTTADLHATLTGCAPGTPGPGEQRGADWRVVPGDRQLYLKREGASGPWRLVAVLYRAPGEGAWRAEYRDFQGNLPRTLRLISSDAKRFDLRLALSQVGVNAPLDPATLQVQVPPGVGPLTIEQLREAGPLADRSPGTP